MEFAAIRPDWCLLEVSELHSRSRFLLVMALACLRGVTLRCINLTKTEPKAMGWQRTFVASHVPFGRLVKMERFPAQDLNPMSRWLPGGFAFKPPGEFVSWVSFSKPTSNGPQETEGWPISSIPRCISRSGFHFPGRLGKWNWGLNHSPHLFFPPLAFTC